MKRYLAALTLLLLVILALDARAPASGSSAALSLDRYAYLPFVARELLPTATPTITPTPIPPFSGWVAVYPIYNAMDGWSLPASAQITISITDSDGFEVNRSSVVIEENGHLPWTQFDAQIHEHDWITLTVEGQQTGFPVEIPRATANPQTNMIVGHARPFTNISAMVAHPRGNFFHADCTADAQGAFSIDFSPDVDWEFGDQLWVGQWLNANGRVYVTEDSPQLYVIPPFAGHSYSVVIPDDGAYIGAFVTGLPPDYDGKVSIIESFESMTGRRLAIVNIFWFMTVDGRYYDFGWLDLPDHFVDGRVLMISWPSADWDNTTSQARPIRYQQIIDGELDQVIRAAARDMAEFGQPVFLRWAWEMDGYWVPQNGPNAFGPEGDQSWEEADDLYSYFGDPTKADGPERFVAAWNHVRSLFRQEGADNAIWVWSPNWIPDPAGPDTLWNTVDNYYPGDDQVDWIGTTTPNFGYGWTNWLSFEQMLDQQQFPPSIADFQLEHPDKPIMIAELACAEQGGSKAEWIDTTYRVIREDYPEVKAILWFSESKEREWQVDSSPESLEAYRAAIADPYFLDRVILVPR